MKSSKNSSEIKETLKKTSLILFVQHSPTLIARFMGPTLGRQGPGGPHVGPMNLAVWVVLWDLHLKSTVSISSSDIIFWTRESVWLLTWEMHLCWFLYEVEQPNVWRSIWSNERLPIFLSFSQILSPNNRLAETNHPEVNFHREIGQYSLYGKNWYHYVLLFSTFCWELMMPSWFVKTYTCAQDLIRHFLIMSSYTCIQMIHIPRKLEQGMSNLLVIIAPADDLTHMDLSVISTPPNLFNTLRPRQNGRHLADDILKCIFLNENVWVSIKISLKFVPKGPINNIPALVQIMASCRPGDKPLSGPVVVSSLTHICVTRPQWVNNWQVIREPVYVCLWSGTKCCCDAPSEGLRDHPSFPWLLSANCRLEETGHPEVNSSQRNRPMPSLTGNIYTIYTT